MANSKKYTRRTINYNKKYSSKNRLSSNSSPLAKKIILSVIIAAAITVIIACLSILFLDKQKLTESRIEQLAIDYYENYFYPNFTSSKDFKKNKDLDSVMNIYNKYGFAPVSLRQLLLYDNEKNAEYSKSLTKYCNQNTTFIKFYIDAPYGKTDYHYDITYSCNY